MLRTDDNYNLYYEGVISTEQETDFKTLIMQHHLATEFAVLLKKNYNLMISDTYGEHRKLIWVLYQILGHFVLSALFAEKVHPPGCEYEARIGFSVEANGNFAYELKNKLFLYDTYQFLEECKKRIARKSIGFDKNCRITSNIKKMDVLDFVAKITPE